MIYTQQIHNCCTARMLYNFPRDFAFIYTGGEKGKQTLRKQIKMYIKAAAEEKQKILQAYVTNEQQLAIEVLKKCGFKKAGRKETRIDKHNTNLYLYYLILEDKHANIRL